MIENTKQQIETTNTPSIIITYYAISPPQIETPE